MYNLFFSQFTTTHHFHTYNPQAQNIIIYMHMDSHIDPYECDTTPTHRFSRVMLLDFHLHNLPEVCYWTFTCIICQGYITGLFSSSMHDTML